MQKRDFETYQTRVRGSRNRPRPPHEVVPARLKRGPRAETRGNLVPRVFVLTTLTRKRRLWGRKWTLGRQNLVLFASKNSKNSGTIRISWSNDAIDMLIDLWSEETIQFPLENSKTSKETREVYSTLQVNNTFYTWFSSDHNMTHLLKDYEVTGLLIDAGQRQIWITHFPRSLLSLYSSLYL